MSLNRKIMPRAAVADGASPFAKHHERIAATLANPRAAAFSGLNAGVDPARIAAALEDSTEAARRAFRLLLRPVWAGIAVALGAAIFFLVVLLKALEDLA